MSYRKKMVSGDPSVCIEPCEIFWEPLGQEISEAVLFDVIYIVWLLFSTWVSWDSPAIQGMIYCIFQDSHGFPRIPKMGGMTWTIDCHGPMDHNYPVVNGGSDSERFGVFIFPVYSLWKMGSQLELRIEFPNHQIVCQLFVNILSIGAQWVFNSLSINCQYFVNMSSMFRQYFVNFLELCYFVVDISGESACCWPQRSIGWRDIGSGLFSGRCWACQMLCLDQFQAWADCGYHARGCSCGTWGSWVGSWSWEFSASFPDYFWMVLGTPQIHVRIVPIDLRRQVSGEIYPYGCRCPQSY